MNPIRRFLNLFRRQKTNPSESSLSRARARELHEARGLVLAMERAERRYERDNTMAMQAEWMEAQQMGPGGLMTRSLSVSEAGEKAVALKERFWEMELSLDSLGWQKERMTGLMEFSRFGIQQIILMSRYYFIKNPLIKRGVKICASYVTGRGFDIASTDEAADKTIQDFLAANEKEFGQTGLVEKIETLYTDGNLFFVFFDEPSKGMLKVGTIDATEIMEIISNPDDSGEPWYFHRQWSAMRFDPKTGVSTYEAMDAWYPALGVSATVASIGGKPVRKEPVLQAKYGGLPKWQFGCPDVYAAIDPARQYKSFLDNWASVNQALARFAWDAKTKGGLGAIQNFSAVLSTTLGNGGGTQIEENSPPVTGSAFVSGPGTTLTPIKTGGSQVNPEQGRRIALFVCSAIGIPETMLLGDASTGSLATAKSLDRPTELKFLKMQQYLKELLTVVVRYALERSARTPSGRMNEAKADPKQVPVTISFPTILEHDVNEMINALVDMATLKGWKYAGTIDFKALCILGMKELGVENPEEVFLAMYPAYNPVQGEGDAQPDPDVEPDPTVRPPASNQEALLASAVSSLRRASEAMNSQGVRR